ncbi:glutathione S-transferase [Herbaspirillum sp. AP02]|uniref:glutathione S-transferase n=1 Tax=unclassified Herbaspirillum TaxID=2624150 RepID=UPI0015DBB9B0|nr:MULTISPECIES: glutathione S-transferase [unclassified Herbaspirillum]MBG7621126.1 glutathione S-transferase [Herbaspirillum sp. AP02]NZD68855.1 glutathione S-transferase [Herbaspirillum sp. AP21]
MKIYDRPGFPNPARIRIVLAVKGLDHAVEFESVDLIGAEHKGAAFLAKNPSGVLPLLELDDGTLIAESTAITEYLDNLDGNPVLTGKTPKEKGLIHMMQRRAESELLDAVGIYFHHATPGLGAALQQFKSPGWAHRKEWGERERDKAIGGMRYFDGVLRGQSFIAGENFSMADITVFAGLAFADAAGIPIDEALTALHQWRVKVLELPAVRQRSGQNFEADDLRRMGF